MRVVILFGLALVASASALVEVQKFYHEAVGIPLAKRIYEQEMAILKQKEETPNDERVVGGVVAPIGSHPYFAGLLISFVGISGNSVCGSSILTVNRLVTAAHCWYDGKNQAYQFVTILGSNFLFSDGTRIATTKVITHPQWTPSTLTNDLAMIYLPTNMVYTAYIQPISLPTTSDLSNTYVGQWVTAAGFGKTSDAQAGASTVVSHVNLQVITNAVCTASFGTTYVHTSTLCTSGSGSVGICGGDSGGPLVLTSNGKDKLVGISSFVAQNKCQGGYPSAFTRVTSFVDFINSHL